MPPTTCWCQPPTITTISKYQCLSLYFYLVCFNPPLYYYLFSLQLIAISHGVIEKTFGKDHMSIIRATTEGEAILPLAQLKEQPPTATPVRHSPAILLNSCNPSCLFSKKPCRLIVSCVADGTEQIKFAVRRQPFNFKFPGSVPPFQAQQLVV